jgi:hypothetical protein
MAYGSYTECLYASAAVGVVATGATNAEKLLNDSTMGVQAMLLPNFWAPTRGQVGRGIHVFGRGIYSTTTTAQSIQFTLRGTPTGAAITGGSVLLQTAAVTPAVSMTAAYWELEGDIILTVIGVAGANSTVQGVGQLRLQNAALSSGLSTLSQAPAYGGGATPGTVATVDTSSPLFLNMNAIFAGTTSASNTLTLQQFKVSALN